MSAVASLPDKIPFSDPGELRRAAREFDQLAGYVGDQGRSVASTTAGVSAGSPDWSGEASDAWRALGAAHAADCRRCATALEQMASAVTWLAGRLQAAQDELDTARATVTAIESEIVAATAVDMALPGPNRAPDLTPQRERAIADGLRAIEDAQRDSRIAAGRFDAIAAGAAQIDDRDGSAPRAGRSGSARRPSKVSLLVAVLLGTVAHNRMKGAGFERAMLRELGLTKNTQRLPAPLRGQLRNVIPDGLTAKELAEIKSSRYQSNSAQIRRMTRLATPTRPFVLVVGPKTRLSRPLAAKINRGDIVLRRWIGRGVFSNNVDPNQLGTLYRRDRVAQTFNRLPPPQQTIAGRPGGPGAVGVPRAPGGAPPPAAPPRGPRVRLPFVR